MIDSPALAVGTELNAHLARQLLSALHAQDFAAAPDNWASGAPVTVMPSIDLAVVAFTTGRAPVFANVLLSREHPGGLVADIDVQAGAVSNTRFDADQRDANLDSPAWMPGADWSRMIWLPVVPNDSARHRVVAPYPASLLKLMVAVGVAMAVDRGLCEWPDVLEPMIVVSDNEATERCLALLHRLGMMDSVNRRFAELGLRTLQINRTTRAGGWRNADGAGVGQIHMTAWDTVRLLWLLDGQAPPAPWLAPGTVLLQAPTRERLRAVLARQQLDEILSSGSLRGQPDWVAGLPDAPAFAHKTGATVNYGADAGIACTEGTHYLVAVISNLGRRYALHPNAATPRRLQALGGAVHRIVESLA